MSDIEAAAIGYDRVTRRLHWTNALLAVVSADGGAPRSLTDSFDENPGFVAWKPDGIYFNALQKTASHLFRLNPGNSQITRITGPDNLMAGSFSRHSGRSFTTCIMNGLNTSCSK